MPDRDLAGGRLYESRTFDSDFILPVFQCAPEKTTPPTRGRIGKSTEGLGHGRGLLAGTMCPRKTGNLAQTYSTYRGVRHTYGAPGTLTQGPSAISNLSFTWDPCRSRVGPPIWRKTSLSWSLGVLAAFSLRRA